MQWMTGWICTQQELVASNLKHGQEGLIKAMKVRGMDVEGDISEQMQTCTWKMQ
jgi:hypothetical protein